MMQIAAEEEMAADREWVAVVDVRAARLREALSALAGVQTAAIPKLMNEACPALRFSARSARHRWFGNS